MAYDHWVHCKDCGAKLFKVAFCDIEIKCKCGAFNVVRIYTASALYLTADQESDMIESYTQSNEVHKPDGGTDTA